MRQQVLSLLLEFVYQQAQMIMFFTISILENQFFYIGNVCHKSLCNKKEPQRPEMCLKTYDVGP